jgi:hypothetical protein
VPDSSIDQGNQAGEEGIKETADRVAHWDADGGAYQLVTLPELSSNDPESDGRAAGERRYQPGAAAMPFDLGGQDGGRALRIPDVPIRSCIDNEVAVPERFGEKRDIVGPDPTAKIEWARALQRAIQFFEGQCFPPVESRPCPDRDLAAETGGQTIGKRMDPAPASAPIDEDDDPANIVPRLHGSACISFVKAGEPPC